MELLESLHAVAAVRDGVHFDICSVYDPENPISDCTCGVPRMLRDLATLLPLPADATQPFRPAWVPPSRAAA